jgi:membrane protease YdiL (CAAX protease family)
MSKKERILTLALVLSISILPFLVASLVAWRFGPPMHRTGALWGGLLQEVNGLALLAYVLHQRRQLATLRPKLTLSTVGYSLALMVTAYAAYWLTATIVNTLHWAWRGTGANFSDTSTILPAGLSIGLILYMFCSPVFEELIVRFFLAGELISLGWTWLAAALLSAGLQASYHLYQGTWNAIALFPLFLVFAIYYGKTGRIWDVVLAHLWMDLMALAAHTAR